MLGYRIADDEAEDSFSFWPILDGSSNAARTDLIANVGSRLFHLPNAAVQADIQRGKRFRRRVQIDGRPLQFHTTGQRSEEKVNQINNPEYAGRIRGDGRPGEEVHRGRPIDARSQSGQRRRQFLETDHRHNERPVRRGTGKGETASKGCRNRRPAPIKRPPYSGIECGGFSIGGNELARDMLEDY